MYQHTEASLNHISSLDLQKNLFILIDFKTVYIKPLSHRTAFGFYDYLYYYQNALQTLSPCPGFTRRLYSVHTARPQRAHGVLEDHTPLPQRLHSALSSTLCKRQAAAFVLSMFKINAAAWRSMRLHSVFTAFTQRCWRLHSTQVVDLQCCGNAVRAPLWCDRALRTQPRHYRQ